MKHTHADEHEGWLAEVLAGERAHDAHEVADWLASCAACRAELAALERVSAELAESGADQRADLAAAARTGVAPGEERLLAKLHELARPPVPGTRRLAPWLLAAAAVLVAVGLLWRSRARDPEPPPVILGNDLVLVEPRGSASFERFAWRYSGRAPGGYLLRIYDATGAERTQPLEIRCKDSNWTPSPAQLMELPQRIEWQVDALGDFGADDVRGSSRPESAWRSP